MRGIIMTSPQCGGTHAFIGLSKDFRLKLVGRHYLGQYYPSGVTHKHEVPGILIDKKSEPPIKARQFICGHSGPFDTKLKVLSVIRDPRNIMYCHWKRRKIDCTFCGWLASPDAIGWAKIIPRNWHWQPKTGECMRVRYEDIRDELVQRRIAQFCGVEWRESRFWGNSKTWSGSPSDWREVLDEDGQTNWRQLWQIATDESWAAWSKANL